MTTFITNLEEFKQGVAEFCKAAPECDRDSLENGMKAVNLMYLSVPTDTLTLALAGSYLKFAHRRYMERDTILIHGHDPLARLKELVGRLTPA